ncbi:MULTISPECIES: NADPH-dependent FMN reductase [Neisseria]|uniref:NADPH-dependent FMN reductase family protein n=1 Tax=Neisseria musculi TaxID=1815583 RepID=A0A7H1MBG9_9NEIS|nr:MULTISPECIES: NADPH-dependent FMN reductase [Neisseria]MBF0804745.1 NAD(P)H-dependent oxidoreductase [Neisseria sp. 19428wB4_WF04]QNT58984.1 NADPH-dependent FMN reductase family protein [Neisseria musculi]TFU40235.1 NAD(P)H-dependent oxidoreductase [Neisseria sp. WF04]
MTQIALIVGSLSKQSINRAVAEHIAAQAPAGVAVEEVQIGDLPLYTQDLDAESVPAYDRVRAQLKAADAVLIVSPEHNRAMPAAVKNIIDIASRPFGQSVWAGKKAAVVTASPGGYGGINSGLQIRQSLQPLGADVLIAPEVFLSRANAALENGKVADERTAQFLNQFAATFYAWAAQ